MAKLLNQEDYKNITKLLLDIMRTWAISEKVQLAILGNPKDIKERHLSTFSQGKKVFDFDDGLLERAKIIMGINASLDTSYPHNNNYHSIWLKTKMKKFKGKSPLELMVQDLGGMRRVWYYLDCTQTWDD
jgi:hypothetical protein